jgi:uncharacterized membrane protein
MKKYFITGLVLLLPLTLTIIIVLFVFNLLTEPFVGLVSNFLRHYGLFSHGILGNDETIIVFSRILILILLFFFTVFLGILGRLVFMHYFIRGWESLVGRIPLVRSIYKTSQDVIQTLFTNTNRSFKQVVLVRFPNAETLSVGLVTRDVIEGLPPALGNLIAVFVPTTPNPTSGFLMLFKREDVIYLDMPVEDALKYILSCGVVAAPFTKAVEKQ